MKIKKENVFFLYIIVIEILLLLFSVFDYINGTYIAKNILEIGITIGLCGCAIILYFALKDFKWIILKKLKKGKCFIAIMGITILIPIIVHHFVYRGGEISEDVWLDFYVTYISFLGALFLGMVVYDWNKNNKLERILNKAKLLSGTLNSVYYQLEQIKADDFWGDRIEYDANWRQLYNEMSVLGYDNEVDIRNKLEKVFILVDTINLLLRDKNIEKAKELYLEFIQRETCSLEKYNWIELRSQIYLIAYLWNSANMPKSWKDEYSIIIERFARRYYRVTEQFIYKYMIDNGIKNIGSEILDPIVYDYLIRFDDVNKLIKVEFDKRIIYQVIFEIEMKLEQDSERIGYIWSTFYLK